MTASPSQFGERMTRRFIVWYGRKARDERAYHDRRAHRPRAGTLRPPMKIALLQINPTVGDLAGNARLILDALRSASAAGADLAVTPELALVGYLPRDLLLSRGFVRAELGGARGAGARRGRSARRCSSACRSRIRRTKDGRCSTPRCCCATAASSSVPQGAAADLRRLRRGPLLRAVPRRAGARHRRHAARHQHLRGHLERSRLLEAAPLPPRSDRGARRAPAPSAIVNLSASPFTAGKHRRREEMLGSMARKHRVPLVYVNQFGGNDDLVFDGRSCVFDADGAVDRARPVVRRRRRDLRSRRRRGRSRRPTISTPESEIWRALVLGTRDYARKCGFTQRRARAVRRHRLGADRGDRRRSARAPITSSAC